MLPQSFNQSGIMPSGANAVRQPRPLAPMFGANLNAASIAGKQNTNPATQLKTPVPTPATVGGVQQVARIPGDGGAVKSAQGIPTPIPANPRRQSRMRTPSDNYQQNVLNSLLEEGTMARNSQDRTPTSELHADLFSTGKAAADFAHAFGKFAALYKSSRQDNAKPSRSAMGESNGLSYAQRPEDHATGMSALQSLDRFRKKQSQDVALASAFVDTCMSRGMDLDQIAQALIKTSGAIAPQLLARVLSGLEKCAEGPAQAPQPPAPQAPQPPAPPAGLDQQKGIEGAGAWLQGLPGRVAAGHVGNAIGQGADAVAGAIGNAPAALAHGVAGVGRAAAGGVGPAQGMAHGMAQIAPQLPRIGGAVNAGVGAAVAEGQNLIGDARNAAIDEQAKRIGSFFGDTHSAIERFTNPMFNAFGYDTATMPAWQRYSMLGGGLAGGLGLLTGNRTLAGLGALGLGAGAYPQLATALNPLLRQHGGFILPGQNPFFNPKQRPEHPDFVGPPALPAPN